MSAGDLAADQLPSALGAQIALCGADEEDDPLLRAIGWLKACWDVGSDHLPLLVVHDLGHLLLRGRSFRFASARHLGGWDDEERELRLAYEDRILGHWSIDPSVRDAHVAVAGLPDEIRDRAVAHAIVLALARPLRSVEGLARGNPAHLRELGLAIHRIPTDEEALGAEWRTWGRELLRRLIEGLPTGRLFSAEDLWEIAHLGALPSDSARLALRELHAAVHAIGPLPSSEMLRVRQRSREVPLDVHDTDAYPTGGFDAVATRGSFENLVRTEIVHVGEGVLEGSGIDLFDVRFVEGELLYYTRDESPLLDAVQTLTVAIDRPAELRTKHARSPAQTLVLATALALVLQADLLRTFGPAGARTTLAWCAATPADRAAIEEEIALLSLTLAAELAHGRVTLSEVDTLDEVPEKGRIVLSPRVEPGRYQGIWLRVDSDRWQWGEQVVDTAARAELRALCDRLLLDVVGARPTR